MLHSCRKLELAAVLCLAVAFAQPSVGATRIAFHDASIKPNHTDKGHCAPNASVGQTFAVTNCPLGALILFAYDVLQAQITGRTPLLEENYDITAQADRPITRSQMKQMLQTLLEDRFKLTLRRETKNVPVYALLLGKDGPKFHQSQLPADEGPKRDVGGAAEFILQNAAMSDIVFALSRRLPDRVVVDKTGLEGKYDLDMSWYLALGKPHPPTVFDAVERIGLRLEAQTGPLEFLAIEHVQTPMSDAP